MGLLFSSRSLEFSYFRHNFFKTVLHPYTGQSSRTLDTLRQSANCSQFHLTSSRVSYFYYPSCLTLSVLNKINPAILLFTFAYYSDKIKMRSPFIGLALVMMMIGFSINISEASSGAKYFGTFFVVAGAYASFPGVVAW